MPRRSSSQGGRGRGYYYLLIFCKAGGGGGNIIVWVRGGLTGRGEGGKIIMIDFLKGGRALSYLPRRSSSQRGGVGGGTIFIFFCKAIILGANEAIERQQVGWRGSGGQRE